MDSDELTEAYQPGYLNPTIASTLPPYFHIEAERITNSFRSGSCWSVKKLPHILQFGEIQKTRHVNTTNNILERPPRIYKAIVAKKHFWNIPYVPTTYDKQHVLEKAAFEVDRNQIESTGRKAGLVIPSRVRAKYEDIFEDINYQYPTSVLGPAVGQPKLENIVREDFSDLPRFTCGAKKNVYSNKKVPEKELGVEWTNKIFAKLVKDWSHLKFTVKFTKSDELLVQFEVALGENGVPQMTDAMLRSLTKYMTTMVLHGEASEMGLKKRGDRWAQFERIPVASSEEEESLDTSSPKSAKSPKGPGSPGVTFATTTNTDTSATSAFQQRYDTTKQLLTYSMYAPWISVGLLNASRAAAYNGRQVAHQRSASEKRLTKLGV